MILNNYICGIKWGIVYYMRWNDRQIRAARNVSHKGVRISRRALFSYKSAIYQLGGARFDLYNHLTHIIKHILLSGHDLRAGVCCV